MLKKKTDTKPPKYQPNEHEFGLITPPIHVGKYLRERRVAFQLPYDIWWMHENNMVRIKHPPYQREAFI